MQLVVVPLMPSSTETLRQLVVPMLIVVVPVLMLVVVGVVVAVVVVAVAITVVVVVVAVIYHPEGQPASSKAQQSALVPCQIMQRPMCVLRLRACSSRVQGAANQQRRAFAT